MPLSQLLQIIGFLIVATVLETSGDAIVRIALHDQVGVTPARIGLFLIGALLVFGYATFLNLAPLEFGQVVGLYIATLFVIWQITNLVFFKQLPTMPILIGGTLIIVGGAIVSFWKA